MHAKHMVLINFSYAALSGGTLLQYVMSEQYNHLMELETNKNKKIKKITFHVNTSSLLFYTYNNNNNNNNSSYKAHNTAIASLCAGKGKKEEEKC